MRQLQKDMKPAIKDLFDFSQIMKNSEPDDGQLTNEDESVNRSEIVQNVSYDLTLALTEWAYYFGSNAIKFDLTEVPSVLNIDFAGDEIASVEVNGSQVDPVFIDNKIQIHDALI